jgi:hypothetical protein
LPALNKRREGADQVAKIPELYQQVVAGRVGMSELMRVVIARRSEKKSTLSLEKKDVFRNRTDQANILLCAGAADLRRRDTLEQKNDITSQHALWALVKIFFHSAHEVDQWIRGAIHTLEETESHRDRIREIKNCRTTALAALKVEELVYQYPQIVNIDLLKQIIYLQASLNRASIRRMESIAEINQRDIAALSEISQNLFGCSVSEWVMQGKLGILPDISQYSFQTACAFARGLLAERNHLEEELKQEATRMEQSQSDRLKNKQDEEKKRISLRQQSIEGVERGSPQASLLAKSGQETKRSHVSFSHESFFDAKYQEKMRQGGFRIVINIPMEKTVRSTVKLVEPSVNVHSRVWRWSLASYPNANAFFKAATEFQDRALNGMCFRYAKMNEEQLLDQSRRHYIPGIDKLMSQGWFIKNYTHSNAENTISLFAEDKCLGKNTYQRAGWISVGYKSGQSMYHLFFHDENNIWSSDDMLNKPPSTEPIEANSSRKQILTNKQDPVQIFHIDERGIFNRRAILKITSTELFTGNERITCIYPLRPC